VGGGEDGSPPVVLRRGGCDYGGGDGCVCGGGWVLRGSVVGDEWVMMA